MCVVRDGSPAVELMDCCACDGAWGRMQSAGVFGLTTSNVVHSDDGLINYPSIYFQHGT